MKRVFIAMLLLSLGLTVGGAATWWYLLHGMHQAEPDADNGEREILYYRNPMDSSITSPEPRQDHMGMDYIPVYADDENGDPEPGMVRVRGAMQQAMNLRTGSVEEGDLTPEIDAFGTVAVDETRQTRIHVRASGWIEDLAVRASGEAVRRGDVLFRLYSPELLNAQEEFLQVRDRGAALDAARQRLRGFGLGEDDISALERSGQPQRRVAVRALQDGVVQALNVREGAFVTPPDTTMTLLDLSRVWILVDLFPRDSDVLDTDQAVDVRLSSHPGKTLSATVDLVEPLLAVSTRTVRVRLLLDNPERDIRPGTDAAVRLGGRSLQDVLHVPAEAVIRTGRQDRLIVQTDEDRFQAREVRLGRRFDDRWQILEGVERGERVVVSGQFLIDSESDTVAELGRLQEADADEVFTVDGEVKAIDPEAGTIRLQHERVPELDWPEMTMDFGLAEDVDLEGVEPGQAVRFRMTVTDDGDYRVVELEPQPETEPDGTDSWAEGKVVEIDAEAREIALDHGPIDSLDMPPMTMTFLVAEGIELDDIEAGMAVRFQAREADPFGYEVTRLEPVNGDREPNDD